MAFPIPFNPNKPDFRELPLPIPWYTRIRYLQENPEWAYYLGVGDEYRSRNSLWFEWSCILICAVYFSNFNSIIIDRNMEITMKKSVMDIVNENEENSNSFMEPNTESSPVQLHLQSQSSLLDKKATNVVTDYEYERSI